MISRGELSWHTLLDNELITVDNVHVHIQLTLLWKQYESPHWSLSPSDVTLTLDSARLDVFRAF